MTWLFKRNLEKLAAGETAEQILYAHPRLTREAIRETLAFAAKALKADVVYPMAFARTPTRSPTIELRLKDSQDGRTPTSI
jgi:hypothetical protein